MRGALHAASRRVTSGWGERVREEQGLEVRNVRKGQEIGISWIYTWPSGGNVGV